MKFSDFENETGNQHYYSQFEMRCNSKDEKQEKICRIKKENSDYKREQPVQIGSALCEQDLYTFNINLSTPKKRSNLEDMFNVTESIVSDISTKIIRKNYNADDIFQLAGLKLLNLVRNPHNAPLVIKDLFANFKNNPIRRNAENIAFRNLLKQGNHKTFPPRLALKNLSLEDRAVWLELIFTMARESSFSKMQRPEGFARYMCKELFNSILIYRYRDYCAAICDKGFVDLTYESCLTFAFNVSHSIVLVLMESPASDQPEGLLRFPEQLDDLTFLRLYNKTAYTQCHTRIYSKSPEILGVTC